MPCAVEQDVLVDLEDADTATQAVLTKTTGLA